MSRDANVSRRDSVSRPDDRPLPHGSEPFSLLKEHTCLTTFHVDVWKTVALILTAAVATVLLSRQPSPAAAATTPTARAKPTIVLVHGAWANSASWDGVITRLESQGYTVDAPPNPLRSLKGDSQTIADYPHDDPRDRSSSSDTPTAAW